MVFTCFTFVTKSNLFISFGSVFIIFFLWRRGGGRTLNMALVYVIACSLVKLIIHLCFKKFPQLLKTRVILILKPGFHMSGKSQTIRDFAVSRPPQILQTYEETRIPDYLEWPGTNRENRERFYFPDTSQMSAMTDDFPNISDKFGTVRKQQNLRLSVILPTYENQALILLGSVRLHYIYL